jgi:hypothetical protein
VFALWRSLVYLAFGVAKLFFPTLDRLLPERPILRTDRVPLKLPAFFNLFSEEILQIKWHGVQPDKNEAASPPDETASQIWGSSRPVSPSSKPQRDHQNLIANCVLARADQERSIEILELLQVRHCSNRSRVVNVRDHHKFIRSTQFRPDSWF